MTLLSRLALTLCLALTAAPAFAQKAYVRNDLLADGQRDLAACPLSHPSPDRRDWRRWLQKSGIAAPIDLMRGQVFDSLEQGNAAAIASAIVSNLPTGSV